MRRRTPRCPTEAVWAIGDQRSQMRTQRQEDLLRYTALPLIYALTAPQERVLVTGNGPDDGLYEVT